VRPACTRVFVHRVVCVVCQGRGPFVKSGGVVSLKQRRLTASICATSMRAYTCDRAFQILTSLVEQETYCWRPRASVQGCGEAVRRFPALDETTCMCKIYSLKWFQRCMRQCLQSFCKIYSFILHILEGPYASSLAKTNRRVFWHQILSSTRISFSNLLDKLRRMRDLPVPLPTA
jgi:hypothetical protein